MSTSTRYLPPEVSVKMTLQPAAVKHVQVCLHAWRRCVYVHRMHVCTSVCIYVIRVLFRVGKFISFSCLFGFVQVSYEHVQPTSMHACM